MPSKRTYPSCEGIFPEADIEIAQRRVMSSYYIMCVNAGMNITWVLI